MNTITKNDPSTGYRYRWFDFRFLDTIFEHMATSNISITPATYYGS